MGLGDVWFVLIGVLFVGYAVFDGFDLGIGTIYPFLGKSEADKAVMRRAVGPVWDGNEVWLLTGGGALFAAFPAVYATVFSGFYLALTLLLFALIFRAVSLEFRHADPAWAKFWDGAFFLGSALPALLFGVAVGNIVRGVPLTAAGEMIAGGGQPYFLGNLLAALNPFSLVIGVLGLVWIILHGTTWLTLKTTGDLRARAARLRKTMLVAFAAMIAVSTVAAAFLVPDAFVRVTGSVAGWIFVVVLVGATVVAWVFASKDKDREAWYCTALGAVGLVGIWAASIYPALVPALAGSAGQALTVSNAASGPLTLLVMLIIAVIGVPLVLWYHFIVYRAYKGRIEAPAEGEDTY
ncbi:MAG TPA: cytochrome d ubiquinol oxidase subunit II [Coriobacteriia bacterium]